MRGLLAASLLGAWLLGACSSNPEPILVPPPPVSSVAPVLSASAPTADPLGERPQVAEPTPFVPPTPEVFDGPGGSKIWLLERHGLPLLSIIAVTPIGASAGGKGGRAHIAADMLDEGTDKLDAVAFSQAIEDLGAQLSSRADREKSTVSLEVLSSKFPEALALMGAAITRPRHAEADWKRTSSLWKNALKARGDDPSNVARLVTSTALWGPDHPYGWPTEGTPEGAQKISLKDVERWHRMIWHPKNVTFVVVGDVGRSRLEEELGKAFSAWKTPPPPDRLGDRLPRDPDHTQDHPGGSTGRTAGGDDGGAPLRVRGRPQPAAAGADQHRPGRLLHLTPQPEPPGRPRLDLRGALALLRDAQRRPVPGAGLHPHRRHRGGAAGDPR